MARRRLVASSRQLTDPENIYGFVKRIRFFCDSVEKFRSSSDARQLTVLDFGCGTGTYVAVPLAESGHDVLGVDIHGPTIDLACKLNQVESLQYSTETTADLISRRAQFDVVVCSEVLEHVADPGSLLADLASLLAPNGIILVTVPNGYGCFERLRRVERFLGYFGVNVLADALLWPFRLAKWWMGSRRVPPLSRSTPMDEHGTGYLNMESPHIQFFRLGEIVGLLEGAGFEITETRGRTVVCGPYVDFWVRVISFRGWIYKLNAALADRLPLKLSADWMFCARKTETVHNT